ncbi:MAG: type 4a pilus biogenesis protein PilO [Candidatus Paceibacterota bacterium]
MSFKPIFVAISFSLALFLLLFMVWPKYQDLKQLNQEVSRVETKLERSKGYVSKLNSLSEQLDQHGEGMSKIETALPSKPGIPSLLNYLYSAAAGSQGLLMKNVGAISQSSYQGNIKKSNLNITLSGAYPSFKNFLKMVEKSSRIIEVNNISFTVPRGEDKAPPQYDVKLSTFFYSE